MTDEKWVVVVQSFSDGDVEEVYGIFPGRSAAEWYANSDLREYDDTTVLRIRQANVDVWA